MVVAISKPLTYIYSKWSIQETVMISLGLQTFLIFCAPQRKRTSSNVVLSFIWSAYLIAGFVGTYGAVLIAISQIYDGEPQQGEQKEKELFAFWISFLLVHRGGPDVITALALEDNELWLRELWQLGYDAVVVALYVVALPNTLWRPMLLVFTTGVIKCVERTLALYTASLGNLLASIIQQPDPGPDYAKLMEEYAAKKDMNMPIQIIMIAESENGPKAGAKVRPVVFTQLNILQYAYKYFNIFKGLVVSLRLTFQQRAESMIFFSQLDHSEALSILEVELNFIYEALFTKTEILHSWLGVISKIISLACLISALLIFQYKNMKDYSVFDAGVTCTLLIGGIALDCIALIMFCLSDWTFVVLRKVKKDVEDLDTRFDDILNWILRVKDLKKAKYKCFKSTKVTPCHEVQERVLSPMHIFMGWKRKEDNCNMCHKVLNTKILIRRWSEHVHAQNLIQYCLQKKPKRIHHTKCFIRNVFDICIGPVNKFIGSVIVSCFRDIKEGSRKFDHKISLWCKDSKWINEEWLRLLFYCTFYIPLLPVRLIKRFEIQAKLDELILTSSDRLTLDMWEHIFTEVKKRSYFTDDRDVVMNGYTARGDWTIRNIQGDDEDTEKRREKLLRYVMEMHYDQSLFVWHIATELLYQTIERTEDNHSYREFSKILSDYMMYLIMMQPSMMATVVGIGKTRFRDTCEEAKRFFKRRHITDRDIKKACKAILSVAAPPEAEPIDVKGDRSKSVLFDGCMLAKELQGFIKKSQGEGQDDKEMWKVVSRVWVELLSYGATNCDPLKHVAQLSKGGELITVVWLLMAHFGLGDYFQINRGDERAKVIVGK